MNQQIRIADKFKKQSAEQLVVMAGAIITGLTDNPAFPAPAVDLKAVQAAAEDLSAALAAQVQGGTAATAEKNNKREALIALLRRLKHYVEDNCENDTAVLLSSGFQAAASTRNRSPLENPAIRSVDFGQSTELVLKVTPCPLQTAGLFTNSKSMTIAGLVPGTVYVFRVRAIGGSTGYSDWSNPVSRICA